MKDELLGKVRRYVEVGWPDKILDAELRSYFLRRNELFIELNTLFWGHRVIIPQSLRSEVINLLHASHIGIVKMKSMARECCWCRTRAKI